jgi:hypothetical protein
LQTHPPIKTTTAVCTAPACFSLGTGNGNNALLVDSLTRFEVVTPFNIEKSTRDRHPPSFKLSLAAFGRDYHMELTRHETLLSDAYGEWRVAADGSLHRQPAPANDADDGGHCFYHGAGGAGSS